MSKQLLLGDEAIAQAALDAGLSGVYAYPGTPSTEITEYIQMAPITAEKNIHNRWCSNEKTAMEAALALLYNSGTRVQELIDLTPICIRFEKPYSVVVKGKGNKKRLVPLDEPIMELLKNYLDETGLCRPGKERHPLFFNAQGGQLSTPGVTYIIKKYADMARFDNPQLIPRKS